MLIRHNLQPGAQSLTIVYTEEGETSHYISLQPAVPKLVWVGWMSKTCYLNKRLKQVIRREERRTKEIIPQIVTEPKD